MRWPLALAMHAMAALAHGAGHPGIPQHSDDCSLFSITRPTSLEEYVCPPANTSAAYAATVEVTYQWKGGGRISAAVNLDQASVGTVYIDPGSDTVRLATASFPWRKSTHPVWC